MTTNTEAIIMTNIMTKTRRRFILGAGGMALAPRAFAQGKYPTRPVKLIVPSPPGGGPDHVARLVAHIWSQRFGQQVVVENIAGASGQVATLGVVRANPDGHTLLFSPPTPITVAENFEPRPVYDARRDLVTAGLVGRNPALLVINSNVKATTLKELIALAKAEPKKLFFGSPGLGNTLHLIAEIVCAKAGMQMTHVPYKGSGPAVTDLMGGQVNMMFDNIPSAISHVRSGKLRALATTGPKRAVSMPDLPTMIEAGVPGYESTAWFGLAMPAGTPRDIIARMNAEGQKAAAAPDFVKRMTDLGYEIVGGTPEQMAAMIQDEIRRWGPIVKASGAKVD
jgi:tripartite-type tricarboxylate transporter receptor subunit TctC